MILDPALCAHSRHFRTKLARSALFIGCILLLAGASSKAMAQYRFDVLNADGGSPQNSVFGDAVLKVVAEAEAGDGRAGLVRAAVTDRQAGLIDRLPVVTERERGSDSRRPFPS